MKIKEIIPEYNKKIRKTPKSFYDGLSHPAFKVTSVMEMAINLYGHEYIENAQNSDNNASQANVNSVESKLK